MYMLFIVQAPESAFPASCKTPAAFIIPSAQTLIAKAIGKANYPEIEIQLPANFIELPWPTEC